MPEESNKTKRMHSKIKIRRRYSKPVLVLKNLKTGVNMNKPPPKHIFEKTILQHTFKFCKPLDCFLTFRLVCKLWQNAAETIKFDQFNESHVLEKYKSHPKFVCKYLKLFKKLRVDIFNNRPMIEWDALGTLIVNNMKNLNEVNTVRFYNKLFSEKQQSFIEEVLKNSNETLKKISLSKLIFPNISFPRTTEIVLNVHDDISPDQFETNFPQIQKNMENLEIVTFHTGYALGYYEKCNFKHFKFINENYPERCISAGNDCDTGSLVEFMPLKIVTDLYNLRMLENPKNNHALEYLEVILFPSEFIVHWGWACFEDILDQHSNLKQIALTFVSYPENDEEELEPVSVDFKNHDDLFWHCSNEKFICNKVLEYLKKRKIQIVTQDKIRGNKFLQSKVANEAGIRWRFSFT